MYMVGACIKVPTHWNDIVADFVTCRKLRPGKSLPGGTQDAARQGPRRTLPIKPTAQGGVGTAKHAERFVAGDFYQSTAAAPYLFLHGREAGAHNLARRDGAELLEQLGRPKQLKEHYSLEGCDGWCRHNGNLWSLALI